MQFLSKYGLLLNERICSCGSKFFPLTIDPPPVKAGNSQTNRVVSPARVHNHLVKQGIKVSKYNQLLYLFDYNMGGFFLYKEPQIR